MLKNRRLGLVALAITGVVLAGCSSSGSKTSTSGSAARTTSSGDASAGVAAATRFLAPYIGHPSEFPVDTPLKSRPKSGTTIANLDCGSPICGFVAQQLKAAAKLAGVQILDVNAGLSPSTVRAAWNTVLAKKPDAVIAGPYDPSIWGPSTIAKVKAAHLPVISLGVTDLSKFGLANYPFGVMGGPASNALQAKSQAAYIAIHDGPKANVVDVTVPELAYSKAWAQVFQQSLAEYCPGCKVSFLSVQQSALGTTSPAQIVSYLQAHPDVNVLTDVDGEATGGLFPALKHAGLSPKIVSTVGGPAELQALKEGQEQAMAEISVPVFTYEALDMALRAAQGMPFTKLEAAGLTVIQMLTPEDITFNPQLGWSGYADYAQRFAKAWGNA